MSSRSLMASHTRASPWIGWWNCGPNSNVIIEAPMFGLIVPILWQSIWHLISEIHSKFYVGFYPFCPFPFEGYSVSVPCPIITNLLMTPNLTCPPEIAAFLTHATFLCLSVEGCPGSWRLPGGRGTACSWPPAGTGTMPSWRRPSRSGWRPTAATRTGWPASWRPSPGPTRRWSTSSSSILRPMWTSGVAAQPSQ